MAELPAGADFDQLRRQAKDLLRAAKNGDAAASVRMARFAERLSLHSAQSAVARSYGFARTAPG